MSTSRLSDTTLMFLREHNEEMKNIEKLLYFLSALEVGLVTFSNLGEYAGLLVTCSIVLLFYSYAFWLLGNAVTSTAIQYEGAFEDSHKNGTPAGDLSAHYERIVSNSNATLIILIAFSGFFSFFALIEEYLVAEIVPTLPQHLIFYLFVTIIVLLLAWWCWLYFASRKTLENFDPNWKIREDVKG